MHNLGAGALPCIILIKFGQGKENQPTNLVGKHSEVESHDGSMGRVWYIYRSMDG